MATRKVCKTVLVLALSLLLLCFLSDAFQPRAQPSFSCRNAVTLRQHAMMSSSSEMTTARTNDKTMSTEWELDCYSRPVVMADGKKLWEVLLTDSTGMYGV